MNAMEYEIVGKHDKKYLKLDLGGRLIQTEQDALTLVALCAENDTNLLLIHGERLSGDFFRLRTGVAGAIIQKFATYNVKAVAVLNKDGIKGKFKEFLAESNGGNVFRAYAGLDEAERWLLGGRSAIIGMR
ncbi:MAG: DUF4180 domain-containing protein [Synergistaceae bacterium]|jgi:hypothetical protein|nr:DUF4180 domain-containing protein [Synergistaceae bacterium]